MNYKEALDIFENEEWSEVESALFYYRWFGEDWLFDMFKGQRESCKKEFIELVEEIKQNKEAKMKNEAHKTIKNTKIEILDLIEDKLNEIIKDNKTEVVSFDDMVSYFHEIVRVCVDNNTPQDRQECLELIDTTGNEKYVDKRVLDNSSIDRYLITMAYECLYQEIFNDDFFQELQNDLNNNEEISPDEARKIIEKIKEYKKNNELGEFEPKDNECQIFVELDFDINKDDFKEPYFNKKQVIELGDGDFKILTYCGKDQRDKLNKNAIVIEHNKGNRYRVYLMEKDKDIDIREFFKYNEKSIGEHNDWNLDPRNYMEKIHKSFSEKKEFVWVINQIVNKLTERSLK